MASIPDHDDCAPRDQLTNLIGTEQALARMGAWQADTGSAAGRALKAMLIGLRRFDAVNLAYGEAAGDGALAEVANRILQFAGEALEGKWLAARVSGGTFLLATTDECSCERWQWLGDELAEAITRPIPRPGRIASVRLWPRVALLRAMEDERPAALLSRLSDTLQEAQLQSGRRCMWADNTIITAGKSTQELEADLLGAIDRNQIEILYQPQFRAADDKLAGAEALARWHHPELGRIGAGALFSIAERADYVGPLSRHIVERALQGAKSWSLPLRLSLNVTPADLSTGSFKEDLLAAVMTSGFSPELLTLEITEQTLVAELDHSARQLAGLVDRGICIALDDFGAGFCNFHYLKRLPLHYLKLDRSMLEGITQDGRDLAVFRGIVAMAKALDLLVIAEGIESEEQRETIAREGCDFYQGFLKSHPLDAKGFKEFTEVNCPG
ncbi:bifunctional diguanylate cyclase/phosphodiesterase [Altericroceibacterium endophyticum]|uniref:EAL domain-containing protein n=1 Tax=Altericroceibacterium endophyticum TaxID=1808508 RepID=A0A6I4T6J6_9SPHN|nr:bifunctional diguanylate cyclase/phosphodiesterase [Altericroceibacterium endophyticum]MXO66059.1 EAL domain-containing protein [Altericroceibacterium endophyticum]